MSRNEKVWTMVLTLVLWTGLLSSGGCGINSSLTDAQQAKDAAVRMAWVEKAIAVAEKHGLAYRVEVNASGRPSIGETVDLYVNTGIEARVIMFGNAAAGREPVPGG